MGLEGFVISRTSPGLRFRISNFSGFNLLDGNAAAHPSGTGSDTRFTASSRGVAATQIMVRALQVDFSAQIVRLAEIIKGAGYNLYHPRRPVFAQPFQPLLRSRADSNRELLELVMHIYRRSHPKVLEPIGR